VWKILDILAKLFDHGDPYEPDEYTDKYDFHIPYIEFDNKKDYQKYIQAMYGEIPKKESLYRQILKRYKRTHE
jgi:hypothetical protein